MCCGEKKKRPRDLRWRAAGVEEDRGFDGWECVRNDVKLRKLKEEGALDREKCTKGTPVLSGTVLTVNDDDPLFYNALRIFRGRSFQGKIIGVALAVIPTKR